MPSNQAFPAAVRPDDSRWRTGGLVALPFLTMLASMIVVPSIRPMFAARGAGDGSMQAFISLGMLGAVLGTPLIARIADRTARPRRLACALAAADALLIGACALSLPVAVVLVLRTLQGACNVGLLSILMVRAARDADGVSTRTGLGAAGAAVTFAVALGPALGGILGTLGWHVPFFAATALNLIVTVGVTRLGAHARRPEMASPPPRVIGSTGHPLLSVPLVMAFIERFTVGCFIVSFAVYARETLGLTDRGASLRLTLFVAPFAMAMLPMWWIAARWSRATLLGVGAFAYGVSLLLLAVTRGASLDLSLIACGISSAMMYAPALSYAGAASPRGGATTTMGLFHAAGCLGMMLGPAVAGVVSATLRHQGYGPAVRYPAIFALAGTAQLVALIALARPIARLRAAERSLVGAVGT